MEKLANNSSNGAKRFSPLQLTLTFLLLFNSLLILAQDGYQDGKKYILGGLEVTGLQSYNEQTVKTYTGLRVGQPITIPGEKISEVINKLWGLELFTDISFYINNIEGEKVFLELNIKERPTLTDVTVYGVKKRKIQDILDDTDLKKGKKITESLISNTKNFLENKYKKQGYLNAKATIATAKDTSETNAETMVINIKKGDKVKIRNFILDGNKQLKKRKLLSAMKKTKEKRFGRFWKKSKYIEDEYENDLDLFIDKYAENGFRDARIISDSIIKVNENNIDILLKLEEGNKYYFGDIDFVGNTVYGDRQLQRVLGIKKGDVYNGVALRERIQDDSKPDAQDIISLYQNYGYLFSSINPVEISAQNDTINFEIRIIEGKETFLDHVTVNGNDRTNDHVIFRELRTRPGQKYSKADIIRTIRELQQLGFFDAEQIQPDIENPDPNAGTVDVNYNLVESGSSQIELQGGYGGGGFIGTLGLSFNNFSIGNIFNKEEYKPVPMGDGQTFALRLQASRTFRVYSLNFAEPWLGGRKPVRFNLSFSRTQQFGVTRDSRGRFQPNKDQQFSITGVSAGLAKRVQWPDDFFTVSHSLGYQLYNFKDYDLGLFNFGDGSVNSFTYTLGISRNAIAGGRIYPRGGSNFEITAKLTPPYSLFSNKDFKEIREQSDDLLEQLSPLDLNDPLRAELGDQREVLEEQRFKWLEYYKIKFKGDWFTTLAGSADHSLVLRANAELGFLGSYNTNIGNVPFERFFVGGTGLGNFTLDGRDIVQLRGYDEQTLTPLNPLTGRSEGGVVFNKYSLELRYPLTLKPSASIYGLTFLEGGNAFNNFQDFNPFEIRRSAGVGLRIFMPAFGLLGIDFGYGFDSDYVNPNGGPSGWQTHFIIGQQF
ncbi:outer membrane protein assembly factor BamA [Maribacter sp. 2-571]|uniref:outer membrane protein assembly factor BamA n=1 Tax=Maribacter sp. 2-571 TaxID=3417569 RepID=UPI003D344274